MRTPDENRQLATEFVKRVMTDHDMAFAESMLAEDFIEHNALSPEMGNGKEAALATFRWMFGASPDLQADVIEILATGDRVAIRATYSGTDNGTGWGAPMGAPATGKSISVEGIDVAVVNEQGKFTEHYGLFDATGMMSQLGLMPAPDQDH